MLRRDLLKAGWLGLFAPFLVNVPQDVTVVNNVATTKPKGIDGKRYYSPYFKNLGIAKSIQLTVDYFSDCNSCNILSIEKNEPYYERHGYIVFPIEAIVEIEYEYGSEKWVGFNPKNHIIKQFNMDRFFHAKFVEGKGEFNGHIELDGIKYMLSCCIFYEGM